MKNYSEIKNLGFTGHRHTEESKKKMSETRKRLGSGKWMLGRKASLESREKMSNSHKLAYKNGIRKVTEIMLKKLIERNKARKGEKRGPMPDWLKKKIADSLKGEKNHMWGKHTSEETKEKIRKKLKNRIFTDEHKEKISKSLLDHKHPNWKGGKHTERYKNIRKEYSRKWAFKNPEKRHIYMTNWRKRRKEYFRSYMNNYVKNRLKSHPQFKLAMSLRRRFYKLVREKNPNAESVINLVGCDMNYLKIYIESKFQSGMSWDNHSYCGWHIDHIRPCSSFDLSDPEQQKQCFHYTNLQPLWMKDNLIKSGRFINEKTQ